MPSIASLLCSSLLLPPPPLHCPRSLPSSSSSLVFRRTHLHPLNYPSKSRFCVVASSSSASFNGLNSGGRSNSDGSKKSVLFNLIEEIEPLDVSLIQKDVPADTVDAMKRTISGMLGLLPSDQFHVLVEAFWEPLSKLLVSSMMTGYTLRNAEYRLCLEKSLDIHQGHFERQKGGAKHDNCDEDLHRNAVISKLTEENDLLPESGRIEEDPPCESMGVQGFMELTPEARDYILHLQSRLSFVKNELHEMRRKNAALQMQHFVGEEKNDLLDYLRSLQPEKVAELSEPTSPELHDTVHSVVHGLLATLSPKMHSKAPPQSKNAGTGTLNVGKQDCAELLENTSLQFQPLVSVTRDYLARLLFWCMLLGHYLRGLEYRLELMQLLTLSGNIESNAQDGEHIA